MAKSPRAISGKALSRQSRNSSNLPAGCLGAFFAIFLVAGIFFFYMAFLVPLLEYMDADNWNEVPCVIVSSKVESHTDDDSNGVTYSVDIHYRYRFDGRQFNSDRYEFFTVATSGRAGKEAIVRQYPPGKETLCYVNPHNPEKSVLVRRLGWNALIGIVPVVFIAVGAGGLVFVFRSKSRKKKSHGDGPSAAAEPAAAAMLAGEAATVQGAAQPSNALYDVAAEDDEDESDEQADDQESYLPPRPPPGPQQLEPDATPLGGFVGALLITLIWNGVVSVFVSIAVNSFLNGDPEWFLTLFMVPFVLIGTALLFNTVKTFLQIFNPRPIITIDDGNLSLGQEVGLRWQFRGRTSVLRGLKIELIGVESATYQRGTSTYTDTEKFARIEVINTSNSQKIPAGSAVLRIPADTMHSLQANRNSISWTLKILGSITFWPDVDVSFPVVIYPPQYGSANDES